MKDVKLTFGCGLYDRMLPLYTKEVLPEGIDLQFINIDSPREVFDRMTGKLEFDAAELSSSEFITRLLAGQCPFIAIPVFPSRAFRHDAITINTRSGIRTPKDLENRRIGVPLYTMSAAVWIRGHLQHDYGVDLSTITWVEGSMDSPGKYGSPNVMPLVRSIPIHANDSGLSLGELLERGEIDAVIGTGTPAVMNHAPHIRRLFPDYRAVEEDFYRRTKIFPIMHLLAIRRDTFEANPFIAASLYNAFCAAKNVAMKKMQETIALRYMLPWLGDHLQETRDVFGDDPWPYGIEENRPTLDALVAYLVEQGLTDRMIPISEIFVPVET